MIIRPFEKKDLETVAKLESLLYKDPWTIKEYQDELFKWQVVNNIADLDMETGKYQAVCGVAYRICYIADGEESVMNIKPWEIIPFEENGVMKYALRYYKTYDAEGNEIVKVDF